MEKAETDSHRDVDIVVKNIIKGQNYITARMEGSTEKVSDYLNGDITIKTFKAGKKVACFSPSGKLSNLIFLQTASSIDKQFQIPP